MVLHFHPKTASPGGVDHLTDIFEGAELALVT